MMNKIIKTLGIFLSLVPLLLLLMAPAYAATPTDDKLFSACGTNALTSNSPICKAKGTIKNPVNQKIKVASDIVAITVGVAAVILIILSGFGMVTSAGNAEAVANARKRLASAVIGLIIVALAWALIAFVTDRLIQ